ncbi:gluconolaconase [Spirosoma sp. HMF4905]|uniref:Gluconolaconase n=1 Tax=Spirosoma arboris TaxID=2682092 RepID=A0A7K1S9E9_9BACT|nr:gluconolaconase [Spirosoma arboris]MVM30462.1 gluconolaconase [Spirosoma arboris]
MNKKTGLLLISLCLVGSLSSHAQTPRIAIPVPGLYPEGLTYSNQTNRFYVSSVTTATIGSVDRQGNYVKLYEDHGLKSTYGLKIDPKLNRLWVCVSDANYSQFSDSTTAKKLGRLIAIDVTTGKKVADVDLTKLYAGKHFINDLAFDNQGNGYVTDSYSPVIYKLDVSGHASVLAKSDWFKGEEVGLNGIVYHPQGFLLVNNTSSGALYKVDLADPTKINRVMIKTFFPGADGMLWMGESLIVIQNKSVDKVFQLVSKDNWQTADVTAATSAEDRFQQPTTGTLVDGQCYVLNSKMNELADLTKRPSKEFSIQLVQFKPSK